MSKSKLALNVVSNLRSLADSIEGLVAALETEDTKSAKQASANLGKTKEAATTEDKAQVSSASDEKQPSLEEVRAVLAAKNKEGHREAVKAIILKYGANKLTALDPAHYVAVLKEVGELK